MEEQLFNKFKELSANDKRNEINLEMDKLFKILEQLTINSEIKNCDVKFNNYDLVKDVNMSNDIYLNQIYENVMNIRKMLMYYLTWKE